MSITGHLLAHLICLSQPFGASRFQPVQIDGCGKKIIHANLEAPLGVLRIPARSVR